MGGFVAPLFPRKIIFRSHVPQQNFESSIEKLWHTKIVKLFCETSFFHFQSITPRKKAGSRLGYSADVINTKQEGFCRTS